MQIKKGLATIAGLVAATGQYMGAVALFLQADDQALALGPLATATATLWKVIEGRMNQATAAIEAGKTMPYSKGLRPIVGTTEFTAHPLVEGMPLDPLLEVPGGGPRPGATP